jgi:glycosyltransferase involved in cell wall biosynthesis
VIEFRRAGRPLVVHVTTTDMSLAWLLGPQLRAFAEAGYEVVGVSAPGPYVEQLEALGVGHVPLQNATRSMAPHRDLLAFAELRRVLRELRPDIVHTHNPKPGWYGRVAARTVGVPAVVNTVHGLYALPTDPPAKRAVVYALERAAAGCSDAELVQNPEDIDQLLRLRVPRDRLHLLGNGIDLTRFDPERFGDVERAWARAEMGAGPDDVVVGVVGRLVAEKGIAEVLAAAAMTAVTTPSLHWALIGPSDDAKADAVGAAELDRARARGVSVLGERADVDRLYAGMDLFVLASHREGFPRAAMEASAMGVPVVASAIRGCRQVVVDGVTGRLVRARDAGLLAATVAGLAADPERRAEMGEAARRRALEEFDQQRVIDTTLAVYGELLARG